jgi:hypothetical protein
MLNTFQDERLASTVLYNIRNKIFIENINFVRKFVTKFNNFQVDRIMIDEPEF